MTKPLYVNMILNSRSVGTIKILDWASCFNCGNVITYSKLKELKKEICVVCKESQWREINE